MKKLLATLTVLAFLAMTTPAAVLAHEGCESGSKDKAAEKENKKDKECSDKKECDDKEKCEKKEGEKTE